MWAIESNIAINLGYNFGSELPDSQSTKENMFNYMLLIVQKEKTYHYLGEAKFSWH